MPGPPSTCPPQEPGISTVIEIDYKPRPAQRAYHEAKERFRVWVAHRRLGKTTAVVNDVIRGVMQSRSFMPCGAYIAPLRNQAKRVAWPLFEYYTREIPGRWTDKAELMIGLPGERRIYVIGSDNPDALRGIGLDDAVIDETAQIDPYAWSQVIRPALADRQGRCTFIGTPKGRLNLFHELWEGAPSYGKDWWRQITRASETRILPAAELKRLQRELRPEEYEQEFECSFNAAITGAYYAKEMGEAEADGRITSVRYEKSLPVYAALDLGWSDLLVAWYFQLAGNECRLLRCDAWHHTSLVDVVHEMRALPFPVWEVICPHDIKQTELGTGKSRLEVLWGLNVNAMVAPKTSVEDGREAVRDLLPRCVFDREGCATGIEGLIQYRTEYDSVLRVYSRKALHDWASHYADAFRYLAVGAPLVSKPEEQRRRARRGNKRYRGVI